MSTLGLGSHILCLHSRRSRQELDLGLVLLSVAIAFHYITKAETVELLGC